MTLPSENIVDFFFPYEKVYVLYHHPCKDGSMAAALIRHEYIDIPAENFIGCQYGTSLAEVVTDNNIPIDAHILMVDFSYPADQLETFFKEHCYGGLVWIIDHHASAIEKIGDFTYPKLRLDLNTNFSGAMLVRNILEMEFTSSQEDLICRIQDRDLWTWEIPNNHEFHAALSLQPLGVESYYHLLANFNWEVHDSMITKGAAILSYQNMLVEQICADTNVKYFISQHYMLNKAIVFSSVLQSEVGHHILENNPKVDIVIIASIKEEGVACSVRSKTGKAREYCESRGGGGHPNAAGFFVPTSEEFWRIV